ncbi:MAG: Rho-binding antiterminator [Methylomonas sp.]|nr:Rho-binding antiterminator [Methylomonas sp.]
MEKCTLTCDQHDYIEIACMFGYRVRLTLEDQQIMEGKAVGTLTDSDKREYLIIDDGQQHRIELMRLKKLQVLTPHARFTEMNF